LGHDVRDRGENLQCPLVVSEHDGHEAAAVVVAVQRGAEGGEGADELDARLATRGPDGQTLRITAPFGLAWVT
jgi:hypothetical protein